MIRVRPSGAVIIPAEPDGAGRRTHFHIRMRSTCRRAVLLAQPLHEIEFSTSDSCRQIRFKPGNAAHRQAEQRGCLCAGPASPCWCWAPPATPPGRWIGASQGGRAPGSGASSAPLITGTGWLPDPPRFSPDLRRGETHYGGGGRARLVPAEGYLRRSATGVSTAFSPIHLLRNTPFRPIQSNYR